MPKSDYSKGKIYKLCSNVDEFFYIGHTANKLTRRLCCHRGSAKRTPDQKVYKHFNEIGIDNMKIILIEKCNVKDKSELRQIEDMHIRRNLNSPYCLNIQRAFVSDEERREDDRKYQIDNAEQIGIQRKAYREENKGRIAEAHKRYYEDNKESIHKYKQDYYEANKEAIRNRTKFHQLKRIICPICNCETRKIAYKRHERSRKHQLNLMEVKSI